MSNDTCTWSEDIRGGWWVSLDPLPDHLFWGVRKADGAMRAAPDRETLIAGMCSADVSKTLREAFAKMDDPELPPELA